MSAAEYAPPQFPIRYYNQKSDLLRPWICGILWESYLSFLIDRKLSCDPLQVQRLLKMVHDILLDTAHVMGMDLMVPCWTMGSIDPKEDHDRLQGEQPDRGIC